jgi:hypothetical protein
MGLNPGDSKPAELLRMKILDDSFNEGSPYYGMFHCGYYGVPIEDCLAKCQRNGIAIRKKDLDSYNDGVFKRGVGQIVKNGSISNASNIEPGIPFENMKLEDFPLLPIGWVGTERRFFPCTEDNKPMQKWGWSRDFTPELYIRCDAKALSPCGWVGQNMLYQGFIVMDIDGRGHGSDDDEVIRFGSMYKDRTFSTEDPKKPGSFHLYFKTNRLIPVRHFPWAKLDLMGNSVNAAVYFKNKIGNGIPMLDLDNGIWQSMMEYQMSRKEKTCR